MKKSTLSIIFGIAGIIILITTANIKLGAEYKKGNIISGMATLPLPPFHHIKEIHSKDADRYGSLINLIQHKDSSAILYNYYGTPDVLYSVINDTLFLEPERNTNNHAYNLTIYFQDLKSIQCSNSSVTINKCTLDSLSIKADNYSNLYFTDVRLKRIQVEASDEANVNLSSQDTIPFAGILLHDHATFKANIAAFVEKEIKMNANSTISFSGFSANNFGIKRTLIQK
jgi:hypothetical protein